MISVQLVARTVGNLVVKILLEEVQLVGNNAF